MNANVKIKKAKIKDDLFLEVNYIEELPGHSKNNHDLSSTVPIHEDLKRAFQALNKHLAILCDEVAVPTKKKLPGLECENFTVRGFSVGGKEEYEGVVLMGNKSGRFGPVTLNSPFKQYRDDEYPFIQELNNDVQAAIREVDAYLFDGKRAPEQQLEMAFESVPELESGANGQEDEGGKIVEMSDEKEG